MAELNDGLRNRPESPLSLDAAIGPQAIATPVVLTRQHTDDLYNLLLSYKDKPTDDSTGEFHLISRMSDKFYQHCISGPGEHVIAGHDSAVAEVVHEQVARVFSEWKEALVKTDPALIERAFCQEPAKCQAVLAVRELLSKTSSLSGEDLFAFLEENPGVNQISPVAFQVKDRRIYPQSWILVPDGDRPLEQLTTKGTASGEIERIYINCHPDQMVPIMRAILDSPELSANLQQMKMLNFPLGERLGEVNLSRYDRVVLYCQTGTKQGFLDVLESRVQSFPDKFYQGKVPLFSREVLPGISTGEEPIQNSRQQRSFSNVRADLMLELCREITRELISNEPEGKAMKLFLDSARSAYRGKADAQYFEEDVSDFLADLKGQNANMIMDRVLHQTTTMLDRDQFYEACIRLLPSVAARERVDPNDLASNLTVS